MVAGPERAAVAVAVWFPCKVLCMSTCMKTITLPVQVEAERGAQAVDIEYVEDGSLGKPVLNIKEAIAAGSYHQPPVDMTTNIGNAAEALQEAEHVIKGARYAAVLLEQAP